MNKCAAMVFLMWLCTYPHQSRRLGVLNRHGHKKREVLSLPRPLPEWVVDHFSRCNITCSGDERLMPRRSITVTGFALLAGRDSIGMVH